ncbi:hypothetical protein [Neoaquamicrobium sediminum]|uniref:hypothetical protein n=1 Tax=Neoaquamicrobium sediminum TaxID=1849104 RepID=UPI0040352606
MNIQTLTGFEPTPKPKPKPTPSPVATSAPIGNADQRLATIEKIRSSVKRDPRPHGVLAALSGVSAGKLEAFISQGKFLEIDDLQRITPIVYGDLHLTDDCELKPGAKVSMNDAAAKSGDEPSAIKLPPELKSVPNKSPSSVRAPTLSQHEAVETFNLLRAIFEPLPIRAIRDGLRQRIDWSAATDIHVGERLDALVQVLFDNRVLFKVSDTTRPNVTLVRVDADGLDWLRNQATRTY